MKQTRITLTRVDVRLAVRDSGEELAPVVLIHGLGGSQLAFTRVVALLAGVSLRRSTPARHYRSRREGLREHPQPR